MSNLLSDEVLDLTIDRAASHDLYAYDAAVREDMPGVIPPCPGTFEHLLDGVEFVD